MAFIAIFNSLDAIPQWPKGQVLASLERDNVEALRILNHLKNRKDGWKFIRECDGIIVEGRLVDSDETGSFVDDEDKKKANKVGCFRAQGIINARVSEIFDLLTDKTRIQEYNEEIASMKEIEIYPGLSNWAKSVWYSSRKYPMGIKAREFCSTANYVKYPNGVH